jgi:hypothetical protein
MPPVREPARLSVSEVRRAIYIASDFDAGPGAPSCHLLGTLFHRVFQALMTSDSDLGWTSVLDAENLDDHERLQEHAYDRILGPFLRQNQAALQDSARMVVTLWNATGHLCRFICQLLINSQKQNVLRFDPDTHQWHGANRFSLEEELTWLVEDSRWSAPVVLTGIADAIWRNPASRRWCVLDLKLGAGSEAADLGQLCLYHEMLRAANHGPAGGIALFHFQPALEHRTLDSSQIEPVKPKLIDLIGRLAGVAGTADLRKPTEAHRELGVRLIQVLEQFGPMAALDSDPIVGPSFLRYHLMPSPGVRVDKILPLGRDIGVQLRLDKPALVRLENSALVVDLQRKDREKLSFAEFRPQLPRGESGNAKVFVGVDLNRQPHFADLSTECPHMLVAGTAGSGKSEWLLTALASLVDTNTPQTLRLLLIDPKRVTFVSQFHNESFLIENGVMATPAEAIAALDKLIELMEARYKLLGRHGCTDLASLQMKAPGEAPPRIVCFCDEYGNLVAKKKDRDLIEASINQLGAKARAAGIHLILATQDPRAQILSPVLKTNLSGRICLKTVSATQSRMMLEENGAESLLGHGDLLFKINGEPLRLQAPLLGQTERTELFSAQYAAG